MKITSFDRQNIKSTVRPALKRALELLTKELGITVETGTARFNEQSMTIKLTMMTNVKGGITSKQEIDFLRNTAVHGVSADRLNKRFNYMGTVYTLKGYKPSRYKYPFVAERNGKQYKLPSIMVKNATWVG